ncbi:MAG: N-acetyltransferase [Chloroflexota bacterium]|jgi:RimJ/RimL family protein N-acetyltransferase|nr:N-acetyltransferase [Chloroflexota bacterium]
MTGRAWVEPVTLEGTHVRLEPMSLEHLAGLTQVGLDAEIWRWMPMFVQAPGDMRTLVEEAIAEAVAGTMVPFTTIERATGKPVGSTRFLSIVPQHRRLEIGWTWLAPGWQHSAVNTEAKLLMLQHAFEKLGALRVEFKTDALNEKSRAALLKIGATEEGVFRHHMVMPGGRRRDSAYYSVIEEEWPRVHQHLESRLARLQRAAEQSTAAAPVADGTSADPTATPAEPSAG